MFNASSKNSTPLRETIALPHASIKSYSRLISPIPVCLTKGRGFARPSDNVPRDRVSIREGNRIDPSLSFNFIHANAPLERDARVHEREERGVARGWPKENQPD